MYKVYWTENERLEAAEFASTAMASALSLTQGLRQRQHGGEDIRFITMVSENPDVVGRSGYDVTGPDYDWKKRRL